MPSMDTMFPGGARERCPIHHSYMPCMHCNTGAFARRTDPGTSKYAAARVDVSAKEKVVLDSLKAYGPGNGHEVAARTGMRLNTVTPRFKPLLKKGLIRNALTQDGGHLKRERQLVWEATGADVDGNG